MSKKATLQEQLLRSQSLSATFISPVTFVRSGDNISYQINITTTNSVGTFSVQVSDDYRIYEPTNAVSSAGNWVDLTLGGGTPFASSANDLINISLNQLPAGAIRIKYTSVTPGTGTCDLFITTKRLGG